MICSTAIARDEHGGYDPPMRWLLHGSLAPAVKEALVRHGHTAVSAPESDLPPDAGYAEILSYAHAKQLEILTTDQSLATHLFEHPQKFKQLIVYLQLPGGEVEQDDAIDRLFERYKRLTPGRLYTVTATRVKIRQLPASN
jgi:hypothetical protein